MKSKIVDYICEPNNYLIKILNPSHSIATVALFIGEKPILYRKYRCNEINYDTANDLVKNFCHHIAESKVKLFKKDDSMYYSIVQQSLKKVYNRLGLLIWEK